MKQVQAMTTLVLIDGITYQIVLPKQYVPLYAKQALMISQEFGGTLYECNFANIKPMKCEGMPFNITNSKNTENNND